MYNKTNIKAPAKRKSARPSISADDFIKRQRLLLEIRRLNAKNDAEAAAIQVEQRKLDRLAARMAALWGTETRNGIEYRATEDLYTI